MSVGAFGKFAEKGENAERTRGVASCYFFPKIVKYPVSRQLRRRSRRGAAARGCPLCHQYLVYLQQSLWGV